MEKERLRLYNEERAVEPSKILKMEVLVRKHDV